MGDQIQESSNLLSRPNHDSFVNEQLDFFGADTPTSRNEINTETVNYGVDDRTALTQILSQIAVCFFLDALEIEARIDFFEWYDSRKDILEGLSPEIVGILATNRPAFTGIPTNKNQVEMWRTITSALKALLLYLSYPNTPLPYANLLENALQFLDELTNDF